MAPPVETINGGPCYGDLKTDVGSRKELGRDTLRKLSAYSSAQYCNNSDSESVLCTGYQENNGSVLCIDSLPQSDHLNSNEMSREMGPLPSDNYGKMDFPREWRVRWLPVGGSNENELHALSSELAALRDRVAWLENALKHVTSDKKQCNLTESKGHFVSAFSIPVNYETDGQIDSVDNDHNDAEISSVESDSESYRNRATLDLENHSNGIGNKSKRHVDNNNYPGMAESFEGNESIEQSGDTMEDIHLNESVEPREENSKLNESVYGTDAESRDRDEFLQQTASDVPVLQDNRERSASDASSVDLSNLFGESHSQMDGDNSVVVDQHSMNGAGQPTVKCALCQGTHSIWKCENFKSYNLDSRWKKAKELGLCFRCLGVRHKASSCKKTKICGINKCRLSHATLLHDENRRKMLRDLKTRKSVDRRISLPAADAGVSDGSFDSARNDEDEPPDHIEPSGDENGEISDFENPVPSEGYSHDVTETKSDMDLMSWLMPIPVPAVDVDPGGS